MGFASSRGLRFQLLVILLAVLVIPVFLMLYDLLAGKSDEVVLENKEGHLTEIVTGLAFELERGGEELTGKELFAVFSRQAKPLVRENKGVRLGLYLVEEDKMFIEGFLHKFRKLTPREQRQREKRISREVSAGIRSALATKEKIVRVGRTWDDEFLECLVPIVIDNKPVAVVWAEEMMHPIFAKSYRFRMLTRYVTLVLFCISAGGLLLVVFNLSRYLERIKEGLETVEKDISFRLPPLPGEMGQISTAINKMAEGLGERAKLKEELRRKEFLAALGGLVTGIAHELRNPLGVLRATVEVMEDDLKDCGAIKDYARRIKKQVDRQNKTVNELLQFGRPDDSVTEALDINEMVTNVLEFSRPLLNKSKVTVETHLGKNLPTLRGSGEKLQQVILNLIINAIQAMSDVSREKKVITIVSSLEGDGVSLCVQDTGKGIGKEDLPHIFEPFYTTKDGGSGLGLAISRQVVEIHGGEIKAGSEPGQGTQITIYLPVKEGGA